MGEEVFSETLSFISGHGSARGGELIKLASKISTLGKFYIFRKNFRAHILSGGDFYFFSFG